MSAYNFQRQFRELIVSGQKLHTIRARRKNGYLPEVGERIKLYTGMRTKRCELLREVEVARVRVIIIEQRGPIDPPRVVLDLQRLSPREIDDLAMNDGFRSYEEFGDFFRRKHGDTFAGYLIEWKP